MPIDAHQLYRDALGDSGTLSEWSISIVDRVGLPVVSTAWRGADGSSAHGIGYGSTSSTATIGAWGEVAERVVMTDALRQLPVRINSYAELVRAHGADAVADPLTLTLPAGSDYTPDRPIGWVAALRWRTGESVWLPIEFAAADRGQWISDAPDPLITPISNGLGAGESVDRAVAHGLLELIQRDGDTVSFRALDQGQVVDLADLADPEALSVLGLLRAAGIEPMVKLASTEFACVVYAVGHDPDDSVPLACSAVGEAAHPDGPTAIAKALAEYASSRARRALVFGPLDQARLLPPDYLDVELTLPVGPQEARALQAMRRWTELPAEQLRALVEPALLRVVDQRPVAALPVGAKQAPAELLDTLLDRLAAFDVLVVPGRIGDVHAVKVVVPGLEVETLSYGRIGERVLRRLLDRGSPLVALGASNRPGQRQIRLTEPALERIGGPAYLDLDAVDALVEPLYPLYREPSRHAVQRLAEAPGPR